MATRFFEQVTQYAPRLLEHYPDEYSLWSIGYTGTEWSSVEECQKSAEEYADFVFCKSREEIYKQAKWRTENMTTEKKAIFTVWRGRPGTEEENNAILRPGMHEEQRENFDCNVVDLNVILTDYIASSSPVDKKILSLLYGWEWHLSPRNRGKYAEWQESLNKSFPSLLDYLKNRGSIDADCCTKNIALDHALVIDQEDYDSKTTDKCKAEFGNIFACPVKIYPSGCIEFQTDDELMDQKINRFLAINAGNCSVSEYQEYYSEENILSL